MSNQQEAGSTTRWPDVVNLIFGTWLLMSPQMLNDAPTGAMVWNVYAVGVVVVVDAILALVSFKIWEEWANLVAGAWLAISPWSMGVALKGVFEWNSVVIGAVVGLLALWSLVAVRGRGAHAA